MKRNKIILGLMVFLIAAMTGSICAGAEDNSIWIPTLGENFFVPDSSNTKTVWLSDPQSGAQVGYVLKGDLTEVKLQSVSWTGPVVDGKAEGKGKLVITYQREIAESRDAKQQLTAFHQLIKTTIQGEVEMVRGLLEGAADLTTLIENTNFSRNEKSSYSSSFVGTFAAGLEDGRGKRLWNGKVLFDGQWKAGQEYNGYIVKTGGKSYAFTYEGEIKDGKANGVGMVTVRNIGVYKGEFKDGKYEGQGIWRYKTVGRGDLSRPDETMGGASYQGMFSNDKPHGHGVYKDGRGQIVYEGEWQDGKPVK